MRRVLCIIAFTLLAVPVFAEVATSVRIERPSREALYGSAIATVDGRDVTVSGYAARAWMVDGGRSVVYSSSDGAGGFENEGQSLWMYNFRTGARRKLMTEIFAIEKVIETRSRTGRRVLLVTMRDGGLGAAHVAVVDPRRGQTWRQRIARFVGIRNGRVAVALYRAEDIGEGARPVQIVYRDLDSLLRRSASRYWPVGLPELRSAITGSVTYRERIALPPDALVTVELVDMTSGASQAVVLDRQRVFTQGRQVPIAFNLRYDPLRISSEGLYHVRARITVEGQTRFSGPGVPVITRESAARDIELVLSPAQ